MVLNACVFRIVVKLGCANAFALQLKSGDSATARKTGWKHRRHILAFGLTKKRSVEFDAAFWFSNFHPMVRGYSAAAGLASFESAMALPLTSTAYKRVRSDKYMRPLVKVGVL